VVGAARFLAGDFDRPINYWINGGAILLSVLVTAISLYEVRPKFKNIIVPCGFVVGLAVLIMSARLVENFDGRQPQPLRASVMLGRKDGKVGALIRPQEAGTAAITIYFHNYSSVPARRFNVGFMTSKDAPFVHMIRTKDLKTGSVSTAGKQEATIPPNSDFFCFPSIVYRAS
jgi:hypothetical protein